eukprot:13943365-Alexandrium_andersonii.AAC.1
MIRRPPRSTHCISSAASDVHKRQRCKRLQRCGPLVVVPLCRSDLPPACGWGAPRCWWRSLSHSQQ